MNINYYSSLNRLVLRTGSVMPLYWLEFSGVRQNPKLLFVMFGQVLFVNTHPRPSASSLNGCGRGAAFEGGTNPLLSTPMWMPKKFMCESAWRLANKSCCILVRSRCAPAGSRCTAWCDAELRAFTSSRLLPESFDKACHSLTNVGCSANMRCNLPTIAPWRGANGLLVAGPVCRRLIGILQRGPLSTVLRTVDLDISSMELLFVRPIMAARTKQVHTPASRAARPSCCGQRLSITSWPSNARSIPLP